MKGGTHPFFCHEGTKTQSFTKFLCVFMANFFGCVKGGTHLFFCHEGTKAQSFTKSLCGSFLSLWLTRSGAYHLNAYEKAGFFAPGHENIGR
ncbi:Uncharacterized protein dnm_005880 [Desulfonema magnum]|uniref:Uncharacterized protein n=1 Tax=Desulfonema magnum TaxID=45655 RepID=A0A975BF56_9BACT|nr:Uncharacterized protein dnm_005880 [Desulfonema magnum]